LVVGVSLLLPSQDVTQNPSGAAQQPDPDHTDQASQVPIAGDPPSASGTTSTRPSKSPASSPSPGTSKTTKATGGPTPTNTPTQPPTPQPPPPRGGSIVNGGFETGSLSGWASAGTTSIASSPVHAGGSAALLGANHPTDGDSTISQSFTAPTGTS